MWAPQRLRIVVFQLPAGTLCPSRACSPRPARASIPRSLPGWTSPAMIAAKQRVVPIQIETSIGSPFAARAPKRAPGRSRPLRTLAKLQSAAQDAQSACSIGSSSGARIHPLRRTGTNFPSGRAAPAVLAEFCDLLRGFDRQAPVGTLAARRITGFLQHSGNNVPRRANWCGQSRAVPSKSGRRIGRSSPDGRAKTTEIRSGSTEKSGCSCKNAEIAALVFLRRERTS